MAVFCFVLFHQIQILIYTQEYIYKRVIIDSCVCRNNYIEKISRRDKGVYAESRPKKKERIHVLFWKVLYWRINVNIVKIFGILIY